MLPLVCGTGTVALLVDYLAQQHFPVWSHQLLSAHNHCSGSCSQSTFDSSGLSAAVFSMLKLLFEESDGDKNAELDREELTLLMKVPRTTTLPAAN